MYRVFKDIEKYNAYTNNGQKLTSGDLYFIDEDEKIIFRTNNVDGTEKTYDIIETSGNIEITQNGEDIDVAQYATATVNVQGGGSDEDLIDAIERDIVTLSIPNGVTTIRNYAFLNCSSLTEVTISDSVTSIGYYAFRDCSGLTSLTIGSGVTSIGDRAFERCSSLTSITFGSGVTSIGNYAFSSCSSLTSIVIPESVTSIGNSVFSGCSGLTSVTIPDGVTSIGGYAFQNCSSLTSITIPSSVTSIGERAFHTCKGLTSVTIGSGVTSIGREVFRGCSGLTSITVEAVTPPTIQSNTFESSYRNPIYVPAESVDAYKAATNWKRYASYIQAIPTA